MPTVSAPSSRATLAITGAAPVPVPPPSPAVTNTRSDPRSTWRRRSIESSAALRPRSGSDPEPSPLVSSRPICSFTVASDIASCCASVLTATNSTPWRSASIMRCSAFRPPPPTPTTRIEARYAEASPRARSACGRAGISGASVGSGTARSRGCSPGSSSGASGSSRHGGRVRRRRRIRLRGDGLGLRLGQSLRQRLGHRSLGDRRRRRRRGGRSCGGRALGGRLGHVLLRPLRLAEEIGQRAFAHACSTFAHA